MNLPDEYRIWYYHYVCSEDSPELQIWVRDQAKETLLHTYPNAKIIREALISAPYESYVFYGGRIRIEATIVYKFDKAL